MEEAQFESSPELSKFWFVYAWGRHDGNKSLYLVFVGVFFSQHLGLLLEQLGQQHLGCFFRTAGHQHLDCF
jgi:hypothetical protein